MRLRALKEVTGEVELFRDDFQIASGLEKALQHERERPPLLAFIHYSAWPQIGRSFESWNPSTRENSYLLIFSGGGIPDATAQRIREAAASVRDFEDHVYVLKSPFPADTNLLQRFVHAFTSYFSKEARGGAGGPTDLSETARPSSKDTLHAEARRRSKLHEALQNVMDRLNREHSGATLASFAILCQGYLAVLATQSEDGWEPKEIVPALSQMGYTSELHKGLQTNIEAKKSAVTDPEWWVLPETNNSDLMGRARNEWDPSDDDWGWEKLCRLLNRINENNKPLDTASDRKLVATAYCALVDRLGGIPCG